MTIRRLVLEYATTAALVAVAIIVAFCADEAATVRGRARSVVRAWRWAAGDSTATRRTAHGAATTTVSTKTTALRLLREVIGDL